MGDRLTYLQSKPILNDFQKKYHEEIIQILRFEIYIHHASRLDLIEFKEKESRDPIRELRKPKCKNGRN